MTSTTRTTRRGADPDALAALEEERRFLLRSIADLDAEHDAGDVDDDDWRSLRDGYTARAAEVLRAIDAGKAALPSRKRARPIVVAAWVIGLLAVGGVAGWLVAHFSGQRTAGQSMTGGAPAMGSSGSGPGTTTNQSGDAATQLLAEARAALNTDPATAIDKYRAVLDIDKTNAEARTYIGWLLARSASGLSDAGKQLALNEAISLFQAVTTSNPSYADAHCFYAITSARFLATPDVATAKEQGQLCLSNNPPSDMVPLIQQFVDSLDTSTTTPTT